MSAVIKKFRSKQQQIDGVQGEHLRQLLLSLDLPERPVSAILSALDQQIASTNGWTFVMLSPRQNAQVVAWLTHNSKRPQSATLLWAFLFEHLRNDTGEIMISREELAEKVGIAPQNISSIMTELANINAINKVKDGRRVRYFMNPMIGTHLSGSARDKAQKESGLLQLKLVEIK